MKISVVCVIVLLCISSANAGWFDDIVDGAKSLLGWTHENAAPIVSTAWQNGKNWTQENVVPAVSDFVDENKPKVQSWWQDSAKPQLSEWWQGAKEKATPVLSAAWQHGKNWTKETAYPAVSEFVGENAPKVEGWWQENVRPKIEDVWTEHAQPQIEQMWQEHGKHAVGRLVDAAADQTHEWLDDGRKAEYERRRRR